MFVNLMHIEEEWHGWIVAIPATFQIIGSTLTGYLVWRAPKRIFILAAFIGLTVSNFLMGPSNLLFFPKWNWLFFIGFGINGFSEGMIFTPIIPEILDSVYLAKNIVEGENDDLDAVIGDKASGLYGSFFSLGTITAPLFGGVVYSLLKDNWYYTCDFFGCLAVVWTLVYLFVNVLPDIKRDRQEI
jgi:MFS family permease